MEKWDKRAGPVKKGEESGAGASLGRWAGLEEALRVGRSTAQLWISVCPPLACSEVV